MSALELETIRASLRRDAARCRDDDDRLRAYETAKACFRSVFDGAEFAALHKLIAAVYLGGSGPAGQQEPATAGDVLSAFLEPRTPFAYPRRSKVR